MVTVASSQYNYKYGNQIHLPYSLAMLYSYIKSKKELSSNFLFEKTFVFRDGVETDIEKCKNCDILLCSCYVWNWKITKHLAKEVKKINPNCLIIFGGPQVPDDTRGFFEKFPFVDILVHGEGEYIIENIFKTFLDDKDWSKVKGISTNSFRTPSQERINSLMDLPSPYLTNLIWDLVDKNSEIDWDTSWETNRGCPYQCTFCDWGSATFTKVRKFEDERLMNEIEWFGENKMRYIDCCDANFGIFEERDKKIAEKLKQQALLKKFPKKFGVAWAKNTTEKILPIAKELRDGGIIGGISLSVQSLDPTTLKNIKRANIKFDKFSDLTTIFRKNDIPTYTEVIVGLPGETLDTFKNGLETIAQTQVGTFLWNICSVLPNAPMNIPEYKEKFKIKTISSPIKLRHASLEYIKRDTIPEAEELVVETYSYTTQELKQMLLYAWAMSTYQNLGIFEHFSIYYHKTQNLSYMSFFDILFEYCKSEASIFSDELKIVEKHFDELFEGKGWDHYDNKLGDVNWPIEEASWLRLVPDKKKLTEESRSFLKFLENKMGYDTSTVLLEDLLKFQVFLLSTKDDVDELKSETFDYNWKNFFINNSAQLEPSKKRYYFKNMILEKDPLKWNYHAVFWGRRARKYKAHPERIFEDKSFLEMNLLETEQKPAHSSNWDL
jgi:radical SAM superfamily enzyme YgiQ (UPF0313 family)